MAATPVSFMSADARPAGSSSLNQQQQQQQQQQQHGSIVAAVVEVVSSNAEVAAQVEACDLTLSSANNNADHLGSEHANSDVAAAAVAALEAEEAAEAKDASEEENDHNNTDHTSPITVTVTSGSTQYIAMAVSGNETLVGDSSVHSTYVQYVDGSPDSALYAATNGQMTYPAYTVVESGAMYSPGNGQYYTSGGGSNSITYSQVAPGQLTQTSGGTFLIQQGVDADGHTLITTTTRASPQTDANGSSSAYLVTGSQSGHSPSSAAVAVGGGADSDSHYSLAHATRVSPATVQWLIDNYETAEGVSLPRSTLYAHYLRHCNEHKLEPVNAASFGKLIRSVFLGLRTRRLGTRGNSKYHYYGIRVKPTSSLNQMSVEESSPPGVQRHHPNGKRGAKGGAHSSSGSLDATSPTHQQYLGDAAAALPHWPDLEADSNQLPPGIDIDDLQAFVTLYRDHCEAMLDAVISLQFNTVETIWRHFWRSANNNEAVDVGMEEDPEKILPKAKLYVLSRCEPVLIFVKKADYQFYQSLVEVLIPDVLRPIPGTLTQAIRNFAKGLENWLLAAMNGCPEDIVLVKVAAVNAFSQTLRRYTSLNHLAQAARAVLHNSAQISQMLSDLNRVDFHNVQEQAAWVCRCDPDLVAWLENDFKATLQNQATLEQWAQWLESVVDRVMKPYEGGSTQEFARVARQFLLKWSFYSSMVIRDLTLRSAASFGSFHLIRLLYDEYMFYLVEHRVAMATGETSIAVMGEFLNLTQRSKEEDDVGSPSVPPSPSGSSGSLHVGVTASLSSQKSGANNNSSSHTSSSHHLHSMADGSSNNSKRPKLS
uniref:Transcription factor RFX3 n=1 Tax=Daphnia magna TaxID=35525 RepID=A0A0P5J0A2_9CRUS